MVRYILDILNVVHHFYIVHSRYAAKFADKLQLPIGGGPFGFIHYSDNENSLYWQGMFLFVADRQTEIFCVIEGRDIFRMRTLKLSPSVFFFFHGITLRFNIFLFWYRIDGYCVVISFDFLFIVEVVKRKNIAPGYVFSFTYIKYNVHQRS